MSLVNLGTIKQFAAQKMHLLSIGQSNVANHGLTQIKEVERAFTYYKGRKLPLSDPLPYASGSGGSVWTRLSAKLVLKGIADEVIISSIAQGGTSIQDWSPNGKCFTLLKNYLAHISDNKFTPVTTVIFHQGERDTLNKTDFYAYKFYLESLLCNIFPIIPKAKIILCRASYRNEIVNEEVIRAQNYLINQYSYVWPGPNTDSLGKNMRYDGTHFNDEGLDIFSNQLMDAIIGSKDNDF